MTTSHEVLQKYPKASNYALKIGKELISLLYIPALYVSIRQNKSDIHRTPKQATRNSLLLFIEFFNKSLFLTPYVKQMKI